MLRDASLSRLGISLVVVCHAGSWISFVEEFAGKRFALIRIHGSVERISGKIESPKPIAESAHLKTVFTTQMSKMQSPGLGFPSAFFKLEIGGANKEERVNLSGTRMMAKPIRIFRGTQRDIANPIASILAVKEGFRLLDMANSPME